jgi:hypothetical protein
LMSRFCPVFGSLPWWKFGLSDPSSLMKATII